MVVLAAPNADTVLVAHERTTKLQRIDVADLIPGVNPYPLDG